MVIIRPLQHIEFVKMNNSFDNIPFNYSILENLSFDLTKTHEIEHWRNILFNRMNFLIRNYIYTMFYYDQGSLMKISVSHLLQKDNQLNIFLTLKTKTLLNNLILFTFWIFLLTMV